MATTKFANSNKLTAVYNHWTGLVCGLDCWTGLLDWTGGLDWWTDINKFIFTLFTNKTYSPVELRRNPVAFPLCRISHGTNKLGLL